MLHEAARRLTSPTRRTPRSWEPEALCAPKTFLEQAEQQAEASCVSHAAEAEEAKSPRSWHWMQTRLPLLGSEVTIAGGEVSFSTLPQPPRLVERGPGEREASFEASEAEMSLPPLWFPPFDSGAAEHVVSLAATLAATNADCGSGY